MFLQTPNGVPHVGWRQLFNQLAASAPARLTVDIHLYKAIAHPVSYTSVLADLTESTYPGYAVQNTALLAGNGEAGRAQNGNVGFGFSPSGVVSPPETVLGAYITNHVGGGLIAILPFNGPVAFGGSTDLIAFSFFWDDQGNTWSYSAVNLPSQP